MLNLGSVPEEGPEGEGEGDEEELEEVIEAAKQNKRMLVERNASLQNKVHQVNHRSALEQPFGEGKGWVEPAPCQHAQPNTSCDAIVPYQSHTASPCKSSCHDTKQLLSTAPCGRLRQANHWQPNVLGPRYGV